MHIVRGIQTRTPFPLRFVCISAEALSPGSICNIKACVAAAAAADSFLPCVENQPPSVERALSSDVM